MNIPIPCEFGNYERCHNMQLPLVGVSWFKWSRGMMAAAANYKKASLKEAAILVEYFPEMAQSIRQNLSTDSIGRDINNKGLKSNKRGKKQNDLI